MIVGFLIKMLYILVLCPVLLAGGVQTLTIDSELGTSIEDCFERLSIGEQLPRDAIYRNVSELTLRECEQICKQDKQCQSYDYGVGAKGNATCNLGNPSEKEIKEKQLLQRHPDYDVYVRRFQCEQSPPSPIDPQFDEPSDIQDDRPIHHRPVFRPVDEKPFTDDYLISSDLAAYGVKRPEYRPQYDERPDDYTNSKPDYDAGPSYGGHKPLDMPYRPPKPAEKPSYNSRPDPYDELQIQDPYRPSKPSNHEEDGPYRRPLLPEKLEYHYITRPKPKPSGYGFQRPQNQYASGYGQGIPYDNDNYIHVEIHDPIVPSYYGHQKPSDQGIYGYGTYSSQNSYSQSQGQYYGSQYNDYGNSQGNRPNYSNPSYSNDYSPKPSYVDQKPYNNQDSYGNNQASYGQSDYSDETYGGNQYYSTTSKPLSQYKPNRGNYQMPHIDYHSQSSYGSNHGGYGSNQTSYGSKPDYGRPHMHSENYRPSYGLRPSYGNDESYHNKPVYDRPNYGNDKPSYGNEKPSYGNEKPSYGNEKPSYGNEKPSYGNDKPSYGNDKPSYGNEKPLYGDEKPSYGNDQPSYVTEKPLYSQQKPSYPSNKPSYGQDQPAYGDNKPDYNNHRPGYGNKPTYDRPSYGANQDAYSNGIGTYGSSQYFGTAQASQYGSSQQSYQSNQASYGGNQPAYSSANHPSTIGPNRPTLDLYGNRPANGKPSYHRPSYGSKRKPTYSQNGGSYGDDIPDYGEDSDFILDAVPDFNDPDPGYGNEKPNKTGVKPVYEYEMEKPNNVPSYIARPGGQVVTSRPMAIGEFNVPVYGRQQTKHPSYEACFRRVLAGKRALRSHVRKVSPCETVDACKVDCATEKTFPCESFNYRLDRSFRGKGLCELMTKPIEAFDIRRDFVEDKDFDFYERDRNSLEPNCPDRLRGGGLLHSGFLSSKPNRIPDRESGWTDRNVDWNDDRHRHRFGDRRGGYNRYDNNNYIPYQILSHSLARDNDEDSWGQYGGAYGGTDRYYKDRNDLHKAINHWRLSSEARSSFGVKTIPNTNFDYNSLGKSGEGPWRYGHGTWKRGRWNSSGMNNGLEYGESNFYKPQSHFHGVNERGHDPIDRGDHGGKVKDCSSRRKPGMSLGSGAVRRALRLRNVVECETACFNEREFKCVSYSFRYSSSQGTHNCFLSERPYRGLELSTDSSSDVYAMPQDKNCATVNNMAWIESECFWHVRSGAAIRDSAESAKLTVAGLGACEAECIRASDFFCRGFSFRFDSPKIGDDLENCLLTSAPVTSLEIEKGLSLNNGHELYSRGNYGRGCEPALYDDVQNRDDECYLQYDMAARLTNSAIRGQARVEDERACGRACNDAPFTCLSFSFNNKATPNTDNCLLSEIRLFDLKQGVDYVHSDDSWLFAFDLFNGQCWRKTHGHQHDDSSQEVPMPLASPPIGNLYSLSEPSGPSGPLGPSGPSGPPVITAPSGPTGSEYHEHNNPPYIHTSGSAYKPDPPRYPPSSNPLSSGSNRPGYKPQFAPGSSLKPGYPTASGSEPSGPGFQPDYTRPEFSDPSGASYQPGYPTATYKPSLSAPDFKPFSHLSDYNPAVSGTQETYHKPDNNPGSKPPFSGPSGPDFSPGYPRPINFESDFTGLPVFKPEYPSPDTFNLKPILPQSDNFRPGPQTISRPDYPRPLNYRPGYHPDAVIKPEFLPVSQRPAHLPTNQDYFPTKPDNFLGIPGYQPSYTPGYPGPNKPILPSPIPRPGRPGIPDRDIGGSVSSWRHYTVSGLPCRTGSTCAQNHVAGHWACEPEGGEIGSWDYCCTPTHRCGYSEGFQKPWCYVGPSEDQWRPCSDKYYPYYQHNTPHPQSHPSGNQISPGYREPDRIPQRPLDRPGQPQGSPGPDFDKPQGPYLNPADRRYWDSLYKNGPQAYYDKLGNPLPGYARVPTSEQPHIKYSHNYPPPGGGTWQQLPQETGGKPPPVLGIPRYWPVAYLHKGPPPNTTYFRYNETEFTTTTELPDRDTTTLQEQPTTTTTIQPIELEKHRDEKQRNISLVLDATTTETATIKQNGTEEEVVQNKTDHEVFTIMNFNIPEEEDDSVKGIDGKLGDFESIEVLNLDDEKNDTAARVKILKAEEKQIEEIGRIIALRRAGRFNPDKESQKDLEDKHIAFAKDLNSNIGRRFNIERKGLIQKVSKDDIEKERATDKSLEVSETAYVRPRRIITTTENIRKAIVNGTVYYDATIKDQRGTYLFKPTRMSKTLKNNDELKIPTVTGNYGNRIGLSRNVDPVRRVRRVFKKRYDPSEVRRRLLEKQKIQHFSSDSE